MILIKGSKQQQKPSITFCLKQFSQEKRTAHVKAVKLKVAPTPVQRSAKSTKVRRQKKEQSRASITSGRKL